MKRSLLSFMGVADFLFYPTSGESLLGMVVVTCAWSRWIKTGEVREGAFCKSLEENTEFSVLVQKQFWGLPGKNANCIQFADKSTTYILYFIRYLLHVLAVLNLMFCLMVTATLWCHTGTLRCEVTSLWL